jgi:phospholipase C
MVVVASCASQTFRVQNAGGSPGPNFAKSHQFEIVSPPNGGRFFISADRAQKRLYSTLPAPDIGGEATFS